MSNTVDKPDFIENDSNKKQSKDKPKSFSIESILSSSNSSNKSLCPNWNISDSQENKNDVNERIDLSSGVVDSTSSDNNEVEFVYEEQNFDRQQRLVSDYYDKYSESSGKYFEN